MNEALLIVWFSWLLFVCILFFQEKTVQQKLSCLFVLFAISLVPYRITMNEFDFSLLYLCIVIWLIYLFTYVSLRFRDMIYICICILGFVGLRLIEIVAPIWFILPSFVIHAIILYVVIRLFVKDVPRQWTIFLSSLFFGQMIFTFIIQSYHMSFVVDNEIFFVLFVYIGLYYIHRFFLSIYIYRRKTNIGKYY